MAGPNDDPRPKFFGSLQSNNYFERLGLPHGASDADVKAAYRRLAKDFHPDRNPSDPTAEEKFKLINEAYGELMLGITSKQVEHPGQRPRQPRETRRPRTPENEATRRRFEELKTEALGVENFEEGGALAETIAREFLEGDRRSDLLWDLTRRLHTVLRRQMQAHTTLESLATLTKTVKEFCKSSSGRFLKAAMFTDELDAKALDFGLELLEKARSKQEVDEALARISAYPVTFAAIIDMRAGEGKEDAMAKIKFLKKIKEGRPRTGERLDALVKEVNEHAFINEKRAEAYKKQVTDVIEAHRRIYYRNGVFTPLKNEGQNPLRDWKPGPEISPVGGSEEG
jgi:hypothetical protein